MQRCFSNPLVRGNQPTSSAGTGKSALNPLRTATAPIVQPKLKLSSRGDKHEREADAVASELASGSQVRHSITPADGSNHNGNSIHPGITDRIRTTVGNGRRIDKSTEEELSQKFGTDFSNVRVHADHESTQLNEVLHANAFTFGNDIYFNRDQYQPSTPDGKKLLTHELTHVVQQSGGNKMVSREEKGGDGGSLSALTLSGQYTLASAFISGIMDGVKSAPKEQADRLIGKFSNIGPLNLYHFTTGFGIGVLEGLWSSLKGLVEGIITLIKVPFMVLNFVIFKLPELAVKYAPQIAKIQTLVDMLQGAAGTFIKRMMDDPSQLKSLLEGIAHGVIQQVKSLGERLGKGVLEFLEKDWHEMGREIGKLVGMILFEVILFLATDAIGNAVKAAARLTAEVAARAAAGVVKFIEGARLLLGEGIAWLGKMIGKARGAMAELFESMRGAFRAIQETLESMSAERRVTTNGMTMEVPVPSAGATTMESRMVRQPGGPSVADLTPPKVHPSNVPGAPKPGVGPTKPRQSGFSSESIEESMQELQNRHNPPGGESLKEMQEGNRSIHRSDSSRAGLHNIDKHHVFPQEHRQWFVDRGMTGVNDIDNFTLPLDKALHQAEHGGGMWRWARPNWQGEYNGLVMRELLAAERAKIARVGEVGGRLTVAEIQEVVFGILRRRNLPTTGFVPY